MVYSNKS